LSTGFIQLPVPDRIRLIENVMFEATNPQVFEWYIKNYGVDVNLFIDHSQTVQLECLRRGI
jgi:phosphosulfolactate synthase (CoM biosynthesis protein A)